MARLAQYDPGNAHAVGYSWGTVGIGYDARKLRELAPTRRPTAGRLALDPAGGRAPGRLRRVDHRLAERRDRRRARFARLRRQPADGADSSPRPSGCCSQCGRRCARSTPRARSMTSPAARSACWSPGAPTCSVARARAREAGVAADFRYVVPKEGSVAWFDSLAIPATRRTRRRRTRSSSSCCGPTSPRATRTSSAARSMNAAATPPAWMRRCATTRASTRARRIREQAAVAARPLAAQSREENRIWSRFRTTGQ